MKKVYILVVILTMAVFLLSGCNVQKTNQVNTQSQVPANAQEAVDKALGTTPPQPQQPYGQQPKK